MELFWVFVALVVADIITTLHGIRVGLEDVWFGRRRLPLLLLSVVQIVAFYIITMLLPLVPYMVYVVYGVLTVRAVIVAWNVYLIRSSRSREKSNFFLSFFQRTGILAA